MFALLYDPLSEIKKVRKESYARLLMYLLTASLFASCGMLFFGLNYAGDVISAGVLVNSIIGFIFAFFVGALFLAFFFSIALHVLDGKGGYYEGLSCVVLSFVAPAVMFFFAGALSFVPYGVIGSILLLTYGGVLSMVTLFRAGKELFSLDYAGVFVGVLACDLSLILTVCAFLYLL